MTFDWSVVWHNAGALLEGIKLTVLLAVTTMLISIPGALGSRPFDVILLADTIGFLDDIQHTFELLHPICTSETRVVVSYHSRLWEPVLRVAELCRLKMPTLTQNWLSTEDIAAILALADFEAIKQEWRQILPKRLAGLGPLVNRFLGT